jgi:hypothetical protein
VSDDVRLPWGERRAAPRVRVREGVKVEIVGRGCVVTLTNVGPGGFAISTDENLASIPRRQFRFTAANEPWSLILNGQMAYCLLRPRSKSLGLGQYVTGFTFSDVEFSEIQKSIAEMLGKVTSST